MGGCGKFWCEGVRVGGCDGVIVGGCDGVRVGGCRGEVGRLCNANKQVREMVLGGV